MNKLTLLVTSIVLLTFFSSCKDDSESAVVPTSMSLNLGEKSYTTDFASYAEFTFNNVSAVTISSEILIENDTTRISIGVPDLSETSYSSDNKVNGLSISFSGTGKLYTTNVQKSSFKVDILSFEENNSLLSGEFSGTLFEVFGPDSIIITNGKFLAQDAIISIGDLFN